MNAVNVVAGFRDDSQLFSLPGSHVLMWPLQHEPGLIYVTNRCCLSEACDFCGYKGHCGFSHGFLD